MNLKKRLIARYRSMELAKKILAILLSISLLQIGMILLIAYHLSATIITEQARELIDENLGQSAGSIQAAFERYDSIIQEIYTNTSYVEDLDIINSWDGEEYYLSMHSLGSKMQDLIYLNDDILGIALVGKYGDECFYDNITHSGQESLCFDDETLHHTLAKQAMEQKDSVYSGLLTREDSRYGTHSFFYIAHQLTDFNNYEKGAVGCVLLCIDESKFRKAYSQGMEENNLSFVVDSYGNIVSIYQEGYSGVNIFGEPLTEPLDKESLDELEHQASLFAEGISYFHARNLDTNAVSILDGEFYIVNIQDLDYSLQRLRYLLIMICLVAALVGVICFVLVFYMSIDIDKSVKKILNAMNEANRGNLDSKIEIEGNDEFSKISQHFNVMLSEIKKSNEQERESLVREKNAEIRSLEVQINPHFLYNTLDTINWLAIEEQQFQISQMVTKLAQILRYTIYNSNEIVSIETELEYLKKYIYLQQQRFEYSFDCTMDLEERALGHRIHKLLLQPLVENAIIHGFSGLDHQGEIRIAVQYLEEGKVFIEVSDNGVGMDEEQIEKLNHYDYRKDKIETSIGIRNVITRVKLYYGEQGDIRFCSDEAGTSIQIIIPAE